MTRAHERRTVPLPRFLVDELGAAMSAAGPDPLVVASPTGTLLRNRNARELWSGLQVRSTRRERILSFPPS